jgi:hypothetical protein
MHPNRRPTAGRRPAPWRNVPAASLVFGFVLGFGLSTGGVPVSAGGDAPVAATPSPSTPAPAAHTVVTVHAWRDFTRYVQELTNAVPPHEELGRRALAERAYLGEEYVREYFAVRGGGDFQIALGDWTALPLTAFGAVRGTLGDLEATARLERDTEELARRFAPYGAAGDTTVFVFLVGDFSAPYTTWHSGRRQVVAVQLESLVPLPSDLPGDAREAIELALVMRPDTLSGLADAAPWAAYAATRQFVPELRERTTAESASLAEYALLHGLSARFAAALYPQSVFGRGVGALRAQTVRALEPEWRTIAAGWFPHGTKPYSAARHEDDIDDRLPDGITLDQALTLVGARMAESWLYATRIGRTVDEPRQIGRQGRVPTLSAWGLLKP